MVETTDHQGVLNNQASANRIRFAHAYGHREIARVALLLENVRVIMWVESFAESTRLIGS